MQRLNPSSSSSILESNSAGAQKRFVSSKDWTLDHLLTQGRRFHSVPRVSALNPELVASALEDYERSGVPLIIEHLDQDPKWAKDMFNIDWLLERYGDEGLSDSTMSQCASYELRTQTSALVMCTNIATST